MKIKILYLILLTTSLKSINLFSSDRRLAPAKSTVDQVTKSTSKRDLVRQNLELRERLSQLDQKHDDLSDLESGLGQLTEVQSPHIMRYRARTTSMHSDDPIAGSVDGLHGTVADFLALQQTQNERQRRVEEDRIRADQSRNDFQDRVYRDIRYSRKTAVVGTACALIYASCGFVIQNWDAICQKLGFGGPSAGGSGGASAGTNSTGC